MEVRINPNRSTPEEREKWKRIREESLPGKEQSVEDLVEVNGVWKRWTMTDTSPPTNSQK